MTRKRQRQPWRGELDFGMQLYYGAITGLTLTVIAWLLAMATKALGVVP